MKPSKRSLLIGLAATLAIAFAGLGVWQAQRLQWKTALIAQIADRAGGPPVPAPPPGDAVGAARAYQAVQVRGLFRNDRETLVQAVTDLGPGYWVVTPLATDQGFVVLVNRGFVPQAMARTRDWSRPNEAGTVTGLLRLSEPRGGFLRANDPVTDRWRSRDVAAIAAARGLSGPVAPYFIDAAGASDGWPRGGLTRLTLPNSHLVYALTWFALCGLCLFGAWRVLRDAGDSDVAEEVPAAS